MSSPGINPLALVAPDLYAQQLAIARRQALAQGLMQSGASESGSSPYGGLKNAGNMLLGAFLAKKADQQMGNLYTGMGQPQQQQPTDTGQITNGPNQGAPMSSPPPMAQQQQPQGQIQPQMAQQPMQQPRTIPSALGSAITPLPGLSQQQSMMEFVNNNAGYWKALNDANALTDQQKQIAAAFPNDPDQQMQALQGIIGKAGMTRYTAGGGVIDGNGNVISTPNQQGIQSTRGPGGQWQTQLVPGAQQALAGAAMAQQVPKAMLTPTTGFTGNNQPVASNALTMSGNAGLAPQLGIGQIIPGANPNALRSVESGNNPNAISPAGAIGPNQVMPQTAANPGFGVAPAQNNSPQAMGNTGDQYLAAMMDRYKNPVLAHIAYNWGPGNTDQWLQSGGNWDKLPQQTQNYLGRIAVAQAIPQGQSSQQPSALLPQLPPGQEPYLTGQAKDAADRHDATVQAASESPMRINVLDNVINLSKQGVATGPGQEFQNALLGYASNVPMLSKVMGPAKDNVAKFQELQKFTYQNAIRSWQAAGGTGTDSQMEAMAHANPNDNLFPQALQGIAQWGKAAELAVQGKANAQDQFLSQKGQTPTNQIQFENQWRNNFDPKVFQYSLLQSPQEKAAFLQQNRITPQIAKGMLVKQQQLKAMGALQ